MRINNCKQNNNSLTINIKPKLVVKIQRLMKLNKKWKHINENLIQSKNYCKKEIIYNPNLKLLIRNQKK